MKKHSKNSSENIFRDSLVVDYVASNLDRKERVDFERKMASDADLLQAVKIETQLRASLLSLDKRNSKHTAISNDGLDKLFSKIDELEANEDTLKHIATLAEPHSNPNWFALTGIAASFAFALLFIYLPTYETAQNYALLSDQTETGNIEFNLLVKQHKVAQVWPNTNLSKEQLSEVFEKNQLTPLSRAGQAWVVTSDQALTPVQLSNLETLEGLQQVRLISFDKSLGKPSK